MQLMRYIPTAVLAAILWTLYLMTTNHPLSGLMQLNLLFGAYMELLVIGSTMAGIRCAEYLGAGTSSHPVSIFVEHVLIGIAAAALFCIPYAISASKIIGEPYGFTDAFLSQGLIVAGVVWLTAISVDLVNGRYRF